MVKGEENQKGTAGVGTVDRASIPSFYLFLYNGRRIIKPELDVWTLYSVHWHKP